MAFNTSLRRLQFEPSARTSDNSTTGLYSKLLPRDVDFTLNISTHDITGTTQYRALNDTAFGNTFNSTIALGAELQAPKEIDDLSEVFYEVLQTSNSTDVLDTIGRFAQSCCDSLEKVSPWERFSSKNLWLAEEANTWRLVYCLYLDSIQERDNNVILKEYEQLSPKKLVSALFRTDSDIRLMQLVIDWLENCASYQDKTIPSTSHGGASIHWENTLHHLENGVSLFDSKSGSTFVTQLDPDAPRRQKKSLHPLDEEDDKNLSRRIFKELRCGRFDEAVTLCLDAGQMWRAIILRGHMLLGYPEPPRHSATFPMEGNPCRSLWKWSCLSLIQCSEENAHLRATLGILCGHLPSALPVCSESWEDLLWAHLRVQVELRVDQFLREHHSSALISTQGNSDDLLEQFEQMPEMSIHRIFGCVNALYKDKSETYYQEMQRHLILEQINSLIHRAVTWANTASFNLIRFLAHLILVLRRIGKDSIQNISDSILKTYVAKLIEQVNTSTVSPELIAYYTSTLPVKDQIEKYSNLMWLIEGKDDRCRVMETGKLAGIDVEAAAKETVKYAINVLKEHNSLADNKTSMMSRNEENNQILIQRISGCLEWFSFYPSQIAEAIQLSNTIIRTLIFKGDVDSASRVLSRLVQFSTPRAIAQQLSSSSNALREHMCLKAYLEAINGYATWYRQHVGGRPKSPEPIPPDCSFTEKVHFEQMKAQADLLQERWMAAGLHQARHTKQLLYNVLLFPGGWMVDDIVSDDLSKEYTPEEVIEREKEQLALRKLCIPEVVLLLLKVLQSGSMDSHVEAVRLAEIIASKAYQLHTLFPKNKLREVLYKISDSSLIMLENNRDPWGFVPSE